MHFFYDELCRLPIGGVLHQHPYDSTIKHLFNRYVYIIIFSERKVNSVLCQQERSRCVPCYTIRVFRTQLEALGAKIVSLFSHFAFSRTQIKPTCGKYCAPILAFCVFRTQKAAAIQRNCVPILAFCVFSDTKCSCRTAKLCPYFRTLRFSDIKGANALQKLCPCSHISTFSDTIGHKKYHFTTNRPKINLSKPNKASANRTERQQAVQNDKE